MVDRAILSVINQTYKDWELIIVDDSPDDYEYCAEVEACVKKYNDPRIIFIKNSKNIGACASRNKAIMRGKGEYVIYLDDDDEYTKDCLERKLSGFTKKEVGLVYSDCYVIEEETGIKRRTNQQKEKGLVFDQLILSNFVYAFPMIRRECFEKCGMFDVKMPALQDYEMWLRIAKQYEFNYIEEPLAIVHLHKEERISSDPKKKIAGMLRLNSINDAYLMKHRYARHICLIHLVPHYIHDHKRITALILWLKAVILAPTDIEINLKHLWGFIRN